MPKNKDIAKENNEGWKTVIDFTEINENGISGRETLDIIKKLDS